MKTTIRITLLWMGICLSCQSKKEAIAQETMKWEGKPVTQQEYDSLLKAHTREFVDAYSSNDSIHKKWNK